MRWRVKTMAMALVVCCAMSVSGHARTLSVATLEYPPYEYEEGGEAKGIAVDIVKEAFRRMGQPIEIRFFSFPRALNNLKTGESDVVFTFYHKPEREAFALYSKETLVNQTISLFVLEDSPIVFGGDWTRLTDNSFGVADFSYGKEFDRIRQSKILKKVEVVPTLPTNMQKFLRKRFEIMPSDRWVALYYYQQLAANPNGSLPKIKELKPAIESFPAYVGFSKINKMEKTRDQFDLALRKMKSDGTYDRIMKKHAQKWKK